MEELKQSNLATMEAIDMNIESFAGISRFCASLYRALLQLTAINPLYSISLEAFLKLFDFKEEEEGEEAAGSDGESAAASSRSFGAFRLTGDEHTVVASLARKVDLTILRADLPLLGLVLAATVAEVRGLEGEGARDRFLETLARLGQEQEPVARLSPCLSEPEARVVVTVLQAEAGPALASLQRLPELSLLQLVAVLASESGRTLGEDLLQHTSQALDISWTVKDGLLFHHIVSLISATVPTIFVYDGSSSPYKAVQELASYQGVGASQVLLLDRESRQQDYRACLDEAMEDGMWVVVANSDHDHNFWTHISFKLYQLKLEAKVHPNYRLFIVIRQASATMVPGYVVQHSFVVCLEPPASQQEHVAMLVAAAPEEVPRERVQRIAEHHAFLRQAALLPALSDEDFLDALELSQLTATCQAVLDTAVVEVYSSGPTLRPLADATHRLGTHFFCQESEAREALRLELLSTEERDCEPFLRCLVAALGGGGREGCEVGEEGGGAWYLSQGRLAERRECRWANTVCQVC